MKLPIPLVSTLIASAFLFGCASHQTHYAWGQYDDSLYKYYKDPADADAYMKTLEQVVQASDKAQRLVAPGLYAEYGYMLLQKKRAAEAIVYFDKEKKAWPESTYFMDGMIKNANIGNKTSPVVITKE